ncbi:MAG: SBBP repeat-containing protein, partial [Anaerolineae bacterium]
MKAVSPPPRNSWSDDVNRRRSLFSRASPPRAASRRRAGFSLALAVALLTALAPVLAPGKVQVQAAPAQASQAVAQVGRPAPRLLLEGAPVDGAHSAASALPVEWPAVVGESNAQGDPSGAFVDQVEAAWQGSPVMFVENVGQFAEGARFQVLGGDRTVWLAEDGLWVTVMEPVSPTLGSSPYRPGEGGRLERENEPRRGVNLKLSFPGANPHPRLEPFDRLDTRVSYFIGSDPARWRADVPVWGGVRYVDLYPGVDLEVTGAGGRWTWRLVERTPSPALPLAEGGSRGVRLRVGGADALTLDGVNYLRLTTAVGDFTLPLLQTVAADGTPVEPATTEPEINGLEVTSPFPFAPAPLPAKRGMRAEISPLALGAVKADEDPPWDDPSDLLYSTFLGGGNRDGAYAIAVDGVGNAYVTGLTRSSDFPTTPGAFDPGLNGEDDAFVVKVNDESGTALIYATFLGGMDDDWGRDVAVDGAGSAYVVGHTSSSNFPTTPGAYDGSHNGRSDAFAVKLNGSGTALGYATFLGGNGYDYGGGIAVDGAGNAYVVGHTSSSDFPTTPGAYDTTPNGGYDTFVVKVDSSGAGLTYATLLGGGDTDYGDDIAVDGSGAAYVTSFTRSSDFPTTPGAYDATHNGDQDGFVVKLSPSGAGLTYATFLGGSGADRGEGIVVDGAGSAYVTGWTGSNDFPATPGADDTTHNGGFSDAFVVKLNAGGTGLAYASYLGGSDADYGYGIVVDEAGSASVTGDTASSDFPATPGAFDPGYNGGLDDAFVVKLTAGGTDLAYATFLGGSDGDRGWGIALDSAGNAYVTGEVYSSDFPTTTQACDTSYDGSGDAFVATLDTASLIDVAVSTHTLTLNDEGWPAPNPLTVTVRVNNVTTETIEDGAILFALDSTDDLARFYVLEENGHGEGLYGGPDQYLEDYYAGEAPLVLAPGETISTTWRVWVQPSEATTLTVSAQLVEWPDELLDEDAEEVRIPLAQIHPVVFVHGILGSMPPGQKLWTERPSYAEVFLPREPVFDPFLLSYYPMLDHLRTMGYEWGKTLFGLTYDWRDSNDVSADFLGDQLAGTVIPQSASLPYVLSDGKADLVVHSMGGLVSRSYIQSEDYNGDVRKVVFVASPHRGFASDYRTREGLTWSDYFENEVPGIADLGLMSFLMDEVLWPYLIEEQYDPTLDEVEEDCIWMPGSYGGGYWNCQPAHYAWTHDDSRGVPSLYEMLPTQDMGVYLFGEGGQPWPCTAGVVPERNQWLEDLNANISALEAGLGLDNIYVLYSEAFPEKTDKTYYVECGQHIYGYWPHGGPTRDRTYAYGDDLIPVNSTSLRESGLLMLPEDNEESIPRYGHKGIVYARDAQKKVAEFLAGVPLTATAEYVPPFALANLMRIVAIIVGSPVEIMVTDPAGQRVGYDPATGAMVAEIPGAFYAGQGDVQFMLLFNTLPGEYRITATGTDAGGYQLETYVVEESGVRLLDIFTGTVTAGQVATHTAAYTTTSTPLFFDDVESGPGNWAAEGGWAPVTDTAHSPVTAWGSGVVTPGQPLTLTLLAGLDLSTARMAGLTFWHTYTLTSGGRAQVELSTDGGATWQTLTTQRGGVHGWTPATLGLTRFAGPEHEPLRLRFRLLPGGPGDRWRIDDVLVEALEPPSLFELPFEDDVEGWRRWEGTGDWAVVTGTLHSGEHSWGATQDGSALTLAGRLDLQEATTPRLSLWHLLEGDGAAGAVEVSPDGTTWLTLTTAGATEGTWQRVEADLSEYAGQMLHLRFRLDAPGGGNWYLDGLAAWEAIPPAVHSLPFDDDMETPEANWRAVNGWEPVTTTAHSGASAWWGSEDDSALILVDRLDLTDAVSPTLTFWQRFDLTEGSVGQVRVTADDGLAWQPVLTVTGPVSDWTQVELDLSGYAGQRVGLAFVLEEMAAGGGAGSAWLEPAVLDEGAGKVQPGPAVPGAATVLPLLAVALAGVVGAGGKKQYQRWAIRIVAVGVTLVVGWQCLYCTGLWRYVPPLRTWTINRLDVVEGCEVELLVSASQKPSTAYLSPDGRWLLSGREGGWRLMNLVEGSERRIESDYGHVRWLEDNLFVEGDTFYGYSLINVPDLEVTRLAKYPKEEMDGVREVELLRQADRVYVVENLGFTGYLFIALDEEFQYSIIPLELTSEEEETLLEELPQAVVVPKSPHATMVMVEGKENPHPRYYSSDDTLYAQWEPIMPFNGVERTPYLEVRTTEGDELIARVRKRGYGPVPLGWSADGRGFYFQMHTGAVAGVLTPESPVYLLRLPDTLPVSTPTPSASGSTSSPRSSGQAPVGEGRVPGAAAALPLLAVALAGVVSAGGKKQYQRWAIRIVGIGLALVVGWQCLYCTGLWRYVPLLRTWTINRLDVVEGCEVELIVSASRNPSGAHLSPNGRWLLTAHRFISD